MNFQARQRKLRDHLATTQFDALLLSHLPNIRYLCGFTGSSGLLLIEESGSLFVTDVRYDTQAHAEVKSAKVVIARQAVLNAAGERIAALRGRKAIAIEADHVTVSDRKRLNDLLPSHLRLKNSSSLVERVRIVKDEDELALIRNAVNLGAKLFERALEVLRPGVKESDVAAEMEYAARRAGAEAMSFPTIIASGARSALPHGRATQQAITPRGFVVCDFGVILAGYCSDQTRTVWVGADSGAKESRATEKEARHAYESVKEAQEAAIAAVRPGVSGLQTNAGRRKALRKTGLGRYFTH